MRGLMTEDGFSFEGEYFRLREAYCNPKPVQKPYPPILIGGAAKNVLRRVVDHGDGWLPLPPP